MPDNIVAIIQARMGSTRLPGKMLKPLGSSDVISLMLSRVRQASSLQHCVVATTVDPLDNALAQRVEALGTPVFRGSEQDVLERFYQCAKHYQADIIVRLTGDCPFHDPEVIDRVVTAFLSKRQKIAYAANVHPPTYPDGLDVEVFSMSALERAWTEAKQPSEREHVTSYIWKHPEIFPSFNVTQDDDRNDSGLRWTLDESRDYDFMTQVMRYIADREAAFRHKDILQLLKDHPELSEINRSLTRNEGYLKSLQKDLHA